MGVTAGLVGVDRLIHYAPPFCLSDVFFPIRCDGEGVRSDGAEVKVGWWGVYSSAALLRMAASSWPVLPSSLGVQVPLLQVKFSQ